MQKEVKIIGIKINKQVGALQSCKVMFDENNRLIAIKGEVGSGKTTLQKSIKIGTVGSAEMKDDKNLYGKIDQEVKLQDGDESIYIGCKTNKAGDLDYLLYTKNSEGKKVENPVIDGVKATPASYLSSLQTSLTWRMDELVSENQTVQRNLLMSIYKTELEKVGVVFDKTSIEYSNSILGKIDLAINERTRLDFERKKVGGFKNQLEDLGVEIENAKTWPVSVDIDALNTLHTTKQIERSNLDNDKISKLKEIKLKGDMIVLDIRQENSVINSDNLIVRNKFSKDYARFTENKKRNSSAISLISEFKQDNLLTEEVSKLIKTLLRDDFINVEPISPTYKSKCMFDENGKISSPFSDFESGSKLRDLIEQLDAVKLKYKSENDRPASDTTEIDKEISIIANNIILGKKTNITCDMISSFNSWSDSDKVVRELREQYFQMLSNVNTGVDGLNISVDKSQEKLDIYLTYNGMYDSDYFGNTGLDNRKVSSYSGTQKTIICLLLQSYLLSQKTKAMRYLWIDNVPVDNKTKHLLNDMGNKLAVTIIVNITGDFTRETLQDGEVLMEGGSIFFNEKN